MMRFIYKVYLAALMVGLILATAACGSAGMPQDIPPMTVEAQATPTNLPEPPATDLPIEIESAPEPTATGLPTEIVEPNSPVSPVAPPAAQPALAPAIQGAPPVLGSEAALAAAIADLAKQTGIPADQITVEKVEPMEWSDTSLGCPQEGMMYAQVITPGYLIVLNAQGNTYEYHTDQRANVVLCNQ